MNEKKRQTVLMYGGICTYWHGQRFILVIASMLSKLADNTTENYFIPSHE
jgi:hypothetical protein